MIHHRTFLSALLVSIPLAAQSPCGLEPLHGLDSPGSRVRYSGPPAIWPLLVFVPPEPWRLQADAPLRLPALPPLDPTPEAPRLPVARSWVHQHPVLAGLTEIGLQLAVHALGGQPVE